MITKRKITTMIIKSKKFTEYLTFDNFEGASLSAKDICDVYGRFAIPVKRTKKMPSGKREKYFAVMVLGDIPESWFTRWGKMK